MNKLHEIFSTGITFIGVFAKLPETSNLGDVCIVDNQTYIYINGWQEMVGDYAQEIEEPDIIHIENQTLIIDFF